MLLHYCGTALRDVLYLHANDRDDREWGVRPTSLRNRKHFTQLQYPKIRRVKIIYWQFIEHFFELSNIKRLIYTKNFIAHTEILKSPSGFRKSAVQIKFSSANTLYIIFCRFIYKLKINSKSSVSVHTSDSVNSFFSIAFSLKRVVKREKKQIYHFRRCSKRSKAD